MFRNKKYAGGDVVLLLAAALLLVLRGAASAARRTFASYPRGHARAAASWRQHAPADGQVWDAQEVSSRVRNFLRGLLELECGERVCFYLDTCPEWQIAAQACFATSITVVTVYASLGAEAAQAMREGDITTLITDRDDVRRAVRKDVRALNVINVKKDFEDILRLGAMSPDRRLDPPTPTRSR